jgi:DNA-binding MarR family transcriptional regulator
VKDFDKENALGYQIHITASIMRNNFNSFLKPYGIYTEQYGVLCTLNVHQSLTLSNLAELIFKDKTTVTRLIDSLEKRGFVKKTPSSTDRRALNVSMTKKGQDLYDEIGACLKIAKENLEKQIDEKDKEIVLKVLKQLKSMNISDEVNTLKKDKKC